MPRAIYALLVAIDDYPNPIPCLHGCVNDIEAFATYLVERADKDADVTLHLCKLQNGEARRQAVIDAFRDHLGKAGPGDVVLFYYSGHGSQEQAPEQFWGLEPDHLNETLVCHDSRQPESWDLADKELAKLIAEISARGPHVAIILDCCHSGSGTRVVEMEETAVRRAPADLRRRPIESFIAIPAEVEQTFSRSAGVDRTGRLFLSRGQHVLFAACRDNEEAKEYYGDGKQRGAFSYFLGEALKTAVGAPTYRDLFSQVSALVSSRIKQQSPQLETMQGGDLDRLFLDGAFRPSPRAFTVSFQDGGWIMNGGAAHGIPVPHDDDAATLALFPFDAPADVLSDPAHALGTAGVVAVLPASSRLEILDGSFEPNTTYKAMVIGVPIPALGVRLEGDAAGCDLVRQALTGGGPSAKPSLFVREATDGEKPEFRLTARANQYVITRPENDRPLVAPITGLTVEGAQLAVRRLEHIARWTQTVRLSNPTSTIKPGDIKLSVLVEDKEVIGREIRLEYRPDQECQWVEPTFKVSMTNTSKRRLYCALLDLTETFKVGAGLIEAGSIRLEPGETAWALGGDPITASVPDELWQQGLIEYKDILKLIVCTQEFDPRLLEQEALDMPTKEAPGHRSLPRDSTLNRLMRQVQTRELGKGKPAAIDDWQTSEFSFTTVRPLPATPVPDAGKVVTLADGVRLHGHPAFKANARLATAPLATRDLGGIALPRLLIDDPTVSRPLSFTTSRGSDAGLSVLELTEVTDASAVGATAPLRLTVPVPLGSNEHVLPVGYDGEFFLPLGRVESRSTAATDIVLDRLPPPLADRRSLGGAIKIFFQKVISRVVGLEFPYPILAANDVAPDGTVAVNGDTFQVRQRVAKAQRIVLFVHGIIGDTRSMVPCVQLGKLADARPLASLYDLVLTFDYENLNTTIEDNGRALKRRLQDVGLGAGHGKVFDIVAHSMGGLVSRWFIEREGGNKVTRRLIMLGTPNGGSPWPRVVDWATLAIAFGLNHLTALAWPASVLAGLTGLIENPTVALNQMNPTSEFLKALHASPDPGVPYVMLAGNTSIISAAAAAPDAKKGSLLGRLLARLTSPDLLHQVANPFFLGQANDIAVAVASMESIAAGRVPAYDVRPVACDHVSYFRDEASLRGLADVLDDRRG